MPIILLVGEDDRLQSTRAAVLHITGAQIVNATVSSAQDLMQSRPCNMLILCHTVPERVVPELASSFRERFGDAPILRMASLGRWDFTGPDGFTEAVPSGDPERLVKRVSALLKLSRAAGPLPTARPPSGVLPQNP